MPIKGAEVLAIVNKMHQEKNIPKEVIFSGIEAALQVAMERATGEEENIAVNIDRITGNIEAKRGESVIDPETLGRIPAQSAKNLIIQKIREAESDTVFQDFLKQQGELVTGTVQRVDQGTAIVTVGKTEALLPRSEQIPGETFHVGARVKAVVMEVRRSGHRVRVVLSRCHPDFVRCLFETEIPEIEDKTIEIRAVAREAGYRTKIAVTSVDTKVDCVGACVGVRGSRIKNIIDELGGERIDIVRWNDSLQVLIPNALQPAEISEVFLYPRLGRAIVLVTEDQLSLAIGRRGQNVRLASKLVGWDIEIMTVEELDESLARAEQWFNEIPNIGPELIEAFITEGFLSFRDLTFLEPTDLAEMAGTSVEEAEEMIDYAETRADEIEEQEEAQAAEEREAAKLQARQAPLGPKILVDERQAAEPAPSAAKEAFESLFAPSAPAGDSESAPAGDSEAANSQDAGETSQSLDASSNEIQQAKDGSVESEAEAAILDRSPTGSEPSTEIKSPEEPGVSESSERQSGEPAQ
jgi:N utilization substance protein A